MRLLYVTATFPFGTGEAYFEPELEELAALGIEIAVVPRSASGLARVHRVPDACVLHSVGLLGPRVLGAAARMIARRPLRTVRALRGLLGDRAHLARNLAVMPKALWLAALAERWGADHIHAHWAGTTATMAMTAAAVAGIPWSFTAHRWDVVDANLARKKVESAAFARTISQEGREILSSNADPADRQKIRVIHMGVEVPGQLDQRLQPAGGGATFTMACIGNLNPGKGQEYLLEALASLKREGRKGLEALIVGDGPQKEELTALCSRLGLEEEVRFLGHVAHHELLRMYADGVVNLVVLPSSFEGIPVALMEAMGYGVPVVATEVGGIPELCGDGCGLLVPIEDADAVARAIGTLLDDRVLLKEVARKGRERVLREFSSQVTAAALAAGLRDGAPSGEGLRTDALT